MRRGLRRLIFSSARGGLLRANWLECFVQHISLSHQIPEKRSRVIGSHARQLMSWYRLFEELGEEGFALVLNLGYQVGICSTQFLEFLLHATQDYYRLTSHQWL